jgi:hypothetical protein
MIESNLCHNFAGRTRKIFLTGKTSIRPFPSKEVMDIAFSVGIFLGYKGLEWVRYLHIDHTLSIVVLAGDVKIVS